MMKVMRVTWAVWHCEAGKPMGGKRGQVVDGLRFRRKFSLVTVQRLYVLGFL